MLNLALNDVMEDDEIDLQADYIPFIRNMVGRLKVLAALTPLLCHPTCLLLWRHYSAVPPAWYIYENTMLLHLPDSLALPLNPHPP